MRRFGFCRFLPELRGVPLVAGLRIVKFDCHKPIVWQEKSPVKKFMQLSLGVEAVTIGSQALLRVHVPQEAMADFIVCLQLLLEGLVQQVVVSTKSYRTTFRLAEELSFALEDTNRCSIQWERRDCECAVSFLLKCYRDGFATVDHLDLQTPDGGYLTLSVDRPAPAVAG